jgi:alpha-L-rhamnosidase
LINFDILPLFEKWFEDIKVSMFEDGSLHGTIPAPDWPWGHACGPVCDCLLYEMPYRVYQYTGKSDMLLQGIPYFERYIAFLEKKIAENHEFILGDWMSSDVECKELKELIAKIYLLKAYDITAFAHQIAGTENTFWTEKAAAWRDTLTVQYVDGIGESTIPMQTAIALLLHFRIGENRPALKNQFLSVIERDGYQLRAGMVGFQYIYHVLSEIGRGDIAYRLLTETEPGYKTWCEYGETTLWEEWGGENRGSHNHHMYSGVISWFFRSLLGIEPKEKAPAFEEIELKPVFIESLSYAKGSIDTVRGKIEAQWVFRDGEFEYTVTIPDGVTASFHGVILKQGCHIFHIKKQGER